jgi:glycosyltransferase involved in cell wall biosynthesis
MASRIRIGVILQGSLGWVGGAEYCKNLLRALYRLPENIQQKFELRPLGTGTDLSLYQDMPARFFLDLRSHATNTRTFWQRLVRYLIRSPKRTNNNRFLASVEDSGIDFLYPYNPEPADTLHLRTAAWIPDFQHKSFPHFFTEEEVRQRDTDHERIARMTSCLVVSSKTVAKDVRTYHPHHHHKSTVLPFRTVVDDAWFIQDPAEQLCRHRVPERYFLVANQFWQHKNHGVIFEALGLLRQVGIRPVLVCTGHLADYRRPQYLEHCRQSLQDLGVNEQVHLLGLIPRLQQIQLMRQSVAVIQPSLFEGWSSVVEDSRALGKPIALSDIAVHREQDPPGATYFSPASAQELAGILKEWWRDLPHGPQRDREESARRDNEVLTAAFAKRFLHIAHSTHPDVAYD